MVEALYIRACSTQTGTPGNQIPPGLFEPTIKCRWANIHLHSLREEIDIFGKNHPYVITTEVDLNLSQYIIKVTHPDIAHALRTTMALGDFANCLRASLDYLAWQLARLSGEIPRRETSFPICDQYTFDSHQQIAKTTFGIPDEAVAIMKSFQPYHAGKDYASNHLYRLSVLSNVDKHRHISAFTLLPEWQIRVGNISGGDIVQEQIDNCTIVRLPLHAKDHVDFNPSNAVDLRFAVPAFSGKSGFEIGYQELVDIYEFIDTGLIPAFAGFFPHPEEPGQPKDGFL